MKPIRHGLFAMVTLLMLASPAFARMAPITGGDLVVILAVLSIPPLACLVSLIMFVWALGSMEKALKRVAPHNRLMKPGRVWLMMVPGVNLIWQFLIATRVPNSLKNEFRERGLDDGSDYGKKLGVRSCILVSFPVLLDLVFLLLLARPQNFPDWMVPIVLIAASIGTTTLVIPYVMAIMFWVKIARYSKQLVNDPPKRLAGQSVVDTAGSGIPV